MWRHPATYLQQRCQMRDVKAPHAVAQPWHMPRLTNGILTSVFKIIKITLVFLRQLVITFNLFKVILALLIRRKCSLKRTLYWQLQFNTHISSLFERTYCQSCIFSFHLFDPSKSKIVLLSYIIYLFSSPYMFPWTPVILFFTNIVIQIYIYLLLIGAFVRKFISTSFTQFPYYIIKCKPYARITFVSFLIYLKLNINYIHSTYHTQNTKLEQ